MTRMPTIRSAGCAGGAGSDGAGAAGTGGVGSGGGSCAKPNTGANAAAEVRPSAAARIAAAPRLRPVGLVALRDWFALARRDTQPLGADAHLDPFRPLFASRDQQLRDGILDVLLDRAPQ